MATSFKKHPSEVQMSLAGEKKSHNENSASVWVMLRLDYDWEKMYMYLNVYMLLSAKSVFINTHSVPSWYWGYPIYYWNLTEGYLYKLASLQWLKSIRKENIQYACKERP